MPSILQFNTGRWVSAKEKKWTGLYFVETVIDLSLFAGRKAKLYVETLHRPEKEGGQLCLAWQQAPQKWNHIEDSVITTRHKNSGHWQLQESELFTIPDIPDVSCMWIMGKCGPDKDQVSCALATVVIMDE